MVKVTGQRFASIERKRKIVFIPSFGFVSILGTIKPLFEKMGLAGRDR
jgi:hypothetical protein